MLQLLRKLILKKCGAFYCVACIGKCEMRTIGVLPKEMQQLMPYEEMRPLVPGSGGTSEKSVTRAWDNHPYRPCRPNDQHGHHQSAEVTWNNATNYHLVVTNSLPWKDPPFLRTVNHLFLWAIYTMAMLNNQRVLQILVSILSFSGLPMQMTGRTPKLHSCLCLWQSTMSCWKLLHLFQSIFPFKYIHKCSL